MHRDRSTADPVVDTHWMAQAIRVAERGLFTTGANPRVGCVIVRDGEMLARASHWRTGSPHAERNALELLARRQISAQGSTAYVTLEPCSHFGRTPPCVDALIAAGVARVVIAMQDPNPLVAGQGSERLRDAGIDVSVGILEQQSWALNPGFVMRMTAGRPFVRAKLAISLDGRTALANGESKWITDAHARRDVQAWRARAQAIVTGSGTVATDDPRLDVRETLADLFLHRGDTLPLLQKAALEREASSTRPSFSATAVAGAVNDAEVGFDDLAWDSPPPQPLRVVLDRRDRLDPGQCSLLREADFQRPVWWVVDSTLARRQPEPRRLNDPAPIGAAVERVFLGDDMPNSEASDGVSRRGERLVVEDQPTGDPSVGESSIADRFWRGLLARLAQAGVNEVHVEAGPTLVAGLYKAGLIDEWLIYQAPVLLGEAARPMLGLGIDDMAARGEVEIIERRVVGSTMRLRARTLHARSAQ